MREPIKKGCFYKCILPALIDLEDTNISRICDMAFDDVDTITTVLFPRTIERIEQRAFSHCSLRYVEIISTNLFVERMAFAFSDIETVKINCSNFICLANHSFYHNDNLREVTLKAKKIVIGDSVFRFNVQLTKFVAHASTVCCGQDMLTGCVNWIY